MRSAKKAVFPPIDAMFPAVRAFEENSGIESYIEDRLGQELYREICAHDRAMRESYGAFLAVFLPEGQRKAQKETE